MSSEATSKELILEGEVMRLAIDAATGAFTSIRNKAAHLELLSRLPRKRCVPWIVGFIAAPGGTSDEHQMDNCRDFERLDIEPLAEPKGFLLLWETTQGPTVQMRVLLREADSGLPERLEFWASADNPTMRILQTLNAPYINGIGPLGSDQEAGLNRLAHSAHSGFLVDDPVGLMERPFAPGEEPFRFWPMRYPNGFHAPMQFFAYYVDGRGGFYFAAHDPHHTAKRIDFQREPNGDIVISTPNYQWNERPGEPMQLEYPYVIAPLVHGDWYEAAELYRRWATGSGRDNPTWAHRGRAEDRAKRGDWAAPATMSRHGCAPSTLPRAGLFSTSSAMTGRLMHPSSLTLQSTKPWCGRWISSGSSGQRAIARNHGSSFMRPADCPRMTGGTNRRFARCLRK